MTFFRQALLLCAAIAAGNPSLAAQPAPAAPAVTVNGRGPDTFVLISGIVGGVAGYRRLEALLAGRGYRVVIIDPYLLSIDSADVSFAALARRVNAVLTQLGVTDARLVGHAHGAGVMLRVASTCSVRISHLYFLDAGALAGNRSPVLSASLRLVPLIVRLPLGRGFVRERLLAGLRENAGRRGWLDAETQRAYTEPLLDHIGPATALAMRMGSSTEPESVSSVVERIRVPATIILGDTPHPSGPGAEEIRALAPLGSLLRVEHLPGIGHFPHEEAPNDVLCILVGAISATIGSLHSVDRCDAETLGFPGSAGVQKR